MNNQDHLDAISRVIGEEFGSHHLPIQPTTTFEDLRFDHIDRSTFLVAMEDETGSAPPTNAEYDWKGVGDVIAWLNRGWH